MHIHNLFNNAGIPSLNNRFYSEEVIKKAIVAKSDFIKFKFEYKKEKIIWDSKLKKTF